jgi:hypothetical protein
MPPGADETRQKLPDQSYQTYLADRDRLKEVEGRFAEYARGLMDAMGMYHPADAGGGCRLQSGCSGCSSN